MNKEIARQKRRQPTKQENRKILLRIQATGKEEGSRAEKKKRTSLEDEERDSRGNENERNSIITKRVFFISSVQRGIQE